MLFFDGLKNIFSSTRSGLVPASGGLANTFLNSNGSFTGLPTSGTVTNVSISPNQGISASVANSSSAPAISIGLTNITPQSVAAQTISASGQSVFQGMNVKGMQQLIKGTDIPSAGTIIIPNDGNYYNITGTTTISRIETSAGYQSGFVVIFHLVSALTMTHNTANSGTQHGMRQAGSANFGGSANDTIMFIYDATTPCWRCISRVLA